METYLFNNITAQISDFDNLCDEIQNLGKFYEYDNCWGLWEPENVPTLVLNIEGEGEEEISCEYAELNQEIDPETGDPRNRYVYLYFPATTSIAGHQDSGYVCTVVYDGNIDAVFGFTSIPEHIDHQQEI